MADSFFSYRIISIHFAVTFWRDMYLSLHHLNRIWTFPDSKAINEFGLWLWRQFYKWTRVPGFFLDFRISLSHICEKGKAWMKWVSVCVCVFCYQKIKCLLKKWTVYIWPAGYFIARFHSICVRRNKDRVKKKSFQRIYSYFALVVTDHLTKHEIKITMF